MYVCTGLPLESGNLVDLNDKDSHVLCYVSWRHLSV